MTKETQLLQYNWTLLTGSLDTLRLSVGKCRKIGVKKEYSFEESESIDSLTSKFARTSDIYTQKVIRSIWSLLKEPFTLFIDMMNQAEKYGVIRSADAMLEIREVRNNIAHEYLPEKIDLLLNDVLTLFPLLEENIETTHIFLKNRKWLKD